MIRFASEMFAGSSLRSSRVAVLVPVLLATLSLSSSAHADEPSTSTVPAPTPAAAPADVSSPAPAAVAAPAPAQPAAAPAQPVSASAAAPEAAPAAAPEAAQSAPKRVHQGFYLRFTSGPSFVSLNGHGPSGSASLTDTGTSASVAIGGALAPGLVLAGTIQGTAFNAEFKGGPFADATVSANGKTRSASNRASGGFGMVGLLVDWYPRPKAGWHTGIATGVGIIDLTNSADESNIGGVNLGGSLFGGYDWTLGRDWGLGLQLVASGATRTKMIADTDHDTGYRLTPVSVSLQASLLYF